MLLAAILTLGINVDLDLRALIDLVQRKPAATSKAPNATCGIKVVGYRFNGKPGQEVAYAGETYTIPPEGFVELISLPRVKYYVAEGRKLPLENGMSPLDAFSFRWITLPAPPAQGGNHE